MRSTLPFSRSQQPQAKNPAALDTIRKLTAAWILKDAAGMAEQLTDDITEIGPVFPHPLLGKKQFFRQYRPYFTGSLQIEEYSILRPRLVALAPRLILVYFSYRLRTHDGALTETSHGQESMLVEKIGRDWKVKFIHWHRQQELRS